MAKKSIYNDLELTRAEAEEHLARLSAKLVELNDQRAAADVQSATLSSGGGSKSYTNRQTAELDAKIAATLLDVNTLKWRLGRGAYPVKPITPIYPCYR